MKRSNSASSSFVRSVLPEYAVKTYVDEKRKECMSYLQADNKTEYEIDKYFETVWRMEKYLERIESLKNSRSADELRLTAKKYGLILSEKEAENVFSRLKRTYQ